MAQDNVVIKFDLQLSPESKSTLDFLTSIGQIDKDAAAQFAKTNAELEKRDVIIDNTTASMQNLSKAAADVSKNIVTGAAEEQIKKLNTATDQATEKTVRLSTQLRQMRNELSQMEQAGLGGTKAFNDLARAAGKLEDQIGDTSRRVRALASDTATIDGLVGVVSGLAGAFSAAQGAAALLGGENEDLQKALLKVQAAMALATGVQQVANTLQKESAARIAITTAAQKAYAFAVGTSTGALRVFRLALAATGVGLFLLAIGAIVENFDKIKAKVVELFPVLNHLGDIWTGIKAAFLGTIAAFVNGISGIGGAISALFKRDLAGIKTSLASINLKKAFNDEVTATYKAAAEAAKVGSEEVAKAVELGGKKIAEARKRAADEIDKAATGGVGSVGASVSRIPEVVSAKAVEDFKTQLALQGAEARFKIRQDEATDQVARDQQLKQELLNTSIQFGNQLFAFGAALNAQQQKNLDDRLKAGNISEQKYAKLSAELKRKQAVADKAAAAFNVALSTATAIAANLKTPILIPFIAALGAAQLATVLAQPIPAFKKGTKKAPAGFKLVGEEGPELLYDKGGYQVFNAGDTKQFFENPFLFPEMLPSIPDEILTQYITNKGGEAIDYNALGKSIAKQLGEEIGKHPKVSLNIDERGFEKHMTEGLNKTKYLDSYYSYNG